MNKKHFKKAFFGEDKMILYLVAMNIICLLLCLLTTNYSYKTEPDYTILYVLFVLLPIANILVVKFQYNNVKYFYGKKCNLCGKEFEIEYGERCECSECHERVNKHIEKLQNNRLPINLEGIENV